MKNYNDTFNILSLRIRNLKTKKCLICFQIPGIVTTARLTHATPAALYAHSPHRYWECDAGLKRDEGYGPSDIIAPGEDNPNYNDTLDIARQLIYDETGKRANVILGGGLRGFKP